MSENGPENDVEIGVTLDERQAHQIALRLSAIMEQAFAQAARASREVFAEAFSGGSGLRRSAAQINQAMSQATAGIQQDVGSLSTGMQQLVQRARALRSELSSRGLDENIFAVYDDALADVLRGQEEFNRRRIELERDPALLAAFEAAQRDRLNALRTEVRIGTNILQQEHGRRIVADQRALTESNTATRLNLARRLAAEQASARQRIEIIRFAARQIQFIENQLARAVRGLANVTVSAFTAAFRGIGSITRSLRRNNAEFNEGLQGALTRRERAMSESFSRQNRIIQQQSQVIDRFNAKASGGLFGFLSGRSAAANALGVTGIIGGGFAAGNLLTSGLERFTQLERITIQLERLTGSAQQTRLILADLIELARTTPLELTDVSQAAVGLLSAGTGLRQLIPFVRSLADAIGFTGGGAEQLQRVGLAIRQIASIGRLQGEELRQLAESLPGLNITKLLADQLTEGNTGELLRLSEAGEISALEFTTAFAAALQSDPRIVGAATATVNTLGGQIAILRESFSALGATIIEAVEPLLLFSIRGTTRRLEFLSDLIKGEVSPNLRILRLGLLGVAAGITALLVARAAGEALQFLAIGMRAVLTPMGALVLAAAALGAAFVLLRSNSEAWAAVTDRVGRALADMVPFLDVNGDGFVTLAEVIQGRILPALNALANIAQTVLVRALQVGLGFIVTFVVPGFAFLADLIVNTLVPGIISLASAVATRAVPILRTLGGILIDIVRFLDPAIDGFRSLGSAIGDAFQGDFSNLFGGLQDAAVGLGTVFANLGVLLFNAIRPQVERAVEFITSALGNINPTAVVISISNVARQIGFILGNIITDPRLIQALEQIALAGALIAARFVQGFAEGVVSNLPQLTRLFADQFFDVLFLALRTAVSSPQVLLGILTAALLGPIAVRAFKNIGTNWGKLTSDGFVAGMKRGSRNVLSSTSAFFRGSDRVAASAARRTRETVVREYQRLARDIEAVGGRTRAISIGAIDRTAVTQLRTQFRELTRNMTDTERQALLARRQFSNIFTGVGLGVRTAAAAIGRTFGRSGTSWSDIRLGMQAARNNISAGFRDIAADMRARGTSLGQTLGAGLLGGIGAAFAGQQGGKAGLLGIITAALTTGLATGSPLVGAAVAGVGLISLAFDKAKSKVQELNEAVQALRGTFDDLSSDATIAEDLATNLASAFAAEFTDAAAALDIAGALPDSFFAAFADAAVTGQIAGQADAFRSVADAIGVTRSESDALVTAFNRAGQTDFTNLDQQLDDLLTRQRELRDIAAFTPNAPGVAEQQAQVAQQITALQAIDAAAQEAGISLDLFAQFVEFLSDQFAANSTAIQLASEEQRLLKDAVDETTTSYARSVATGNASADALERTAEAAGQTGNAFLDALRFIPEGFQVTEGFLRQLYDQLVRTGSALLGNFDFEAWIQGWKDSSVVVEFTADHLERMAGTSLPQLIEAAEVTIDTFDLVRSAIEEINDARTDKINQRITFLRDQLEGAEEAAARARDRLTEFLTGRFQDTPQRLVDELIGSLGDIGSAVEDAMIQGGIRGEAGMRVAVGGFEQQLANIIQAGFESGLRSQGEFEALLAPLFGGLDEEVQDSFARILSTEEFDFGVGDDSAARLREAIARALADGQIEANIQGIFDADANVARIQRELDFQTTQLDVELVVDAEQVKNALANAGIDPRILADITGATVTQAQISGLAAVVAAVNAQLNGQPPPGEITINQTLNTEIGVTGTQKEEIAADVITRQGAVAANARQLISGVRGRFE